MDLQAIETLIQKVGLKITAARKAVLETVIMSSKPLSIEELMGIIKNKSINVDIVTIYRTLHQFEKKKIIKKIGLKENRYRYESLLSPHHHHLVCIQCGTIKDIHSDQLETKIKKLIDEAKSSFDFTVKSHDLEFFGTCKTCSN